MSNSQATVMRGAAAVGNGQGDNAHPYVIYAKDFSQARQAVAVPLVWGVARRSGIYLFPVWALRSVQKSVSTGGGK